MSVWNASSWSCHSRLMNTFHPKKLLLSKWTAVQPLDRQKHFIVTKVIQLERPVDPIGEIDRGSQVGDKACEAASTPRIEWVEIEAVHSGRVRRIPWRELRDTATWRQGWV